MLQVCIVAAKAGEVILAPFTVIAALVGLNVYPLLLGVTVYEPLTMPVKV
jgi:hypothetical protein